MEIPHTIIERIHDIEEQWPDALTTIYGPDSRIVYASPNHSQSGWTQADMIGSHWTKFVPKRDYPHGELALQDALLNEESTEIGVTGLTKYGQHVRMRVKGWRLLDPDTGETYVLVRSLLVDKVSSRQDLDNVKTRCAWVGVNPLYIEYHDREWGVPVHNDIKLFEFLILEGAQAGLSWLTILKRREGYRRAFAEFDPAIVAGFTEHDQQTLLIDSRIIRNRLKVQSAINNAHKFIDIQKEFGSFDLYQWRFVGGKPLQNGWSSVSEVPAISPQAVALSSDLKKRGFKFVGPTIIYAHMQASGMVNDHTTDCFRYDEIRKL